MTLVKSNLCPTCGGLLDIDLDKQRYVCSYCGVSFDYEYFREDNVKEVASKAVKRNEYGSAKDAYDFMLSKDPHDFEALRGLFICKNKWQSMSIMKRDTEVHVSADEPTLLKAIENSRPEDRPYFEKVREALSELAHYRELTSEATDLSRRKEDENKALGLIKEEYYYNQHQFTELCHEAWDQDEKSRSLRLLCGHSSLIDCGSSDLEQGMGTPYLHCGSGRNYNRRLSPGEGDQCKPSP